MQRSIAHALTGAAIATGAVLRVVAQVLAGAAVATGALASIFTSGGAFIVRHAPRRSTRDSSVATRDNRSSSIGRSAGESSLGE
jgi:hypothetical protein